ncbi:MAG: YqeG family HAD IIIA-type phosphatase [Ruminococcaceae bacterium]|nr:YqeG family HAD IIIA-type phosphatase [Oscillospiraceae bacterium]
MFKHMTADMYIDDVASIDPENLKKLGIKGVLFDIDNTLEPYHTEKPGRATKELFERFTAAGLKVAILSNAKEPRAMEFCRDFTDNWVAKAGKPLKKGYIKLAEIMELKPDEMASVGDQLFTDILGGNIFGCYTICVKPIDKIEPPFVAFKRFFEKPFMKGKFHAE